MRGRCRARVSDWACSLCEEQLCEGSRLNTLGHVCVQIRSCWVSENGEAKRPLRRERQGRNVGLVRTPEPRGKTNESADALP